jgi:hypothetical protein
MMDRAASGTPWLSSKPLSSCVRCDGLVETAYNAILPGLFGQVEGRSFLQAVGIAPWVAPFCDWTNRSASAIFRREITNSGVKGLQ